MLSVPLVCRTATPTDIERLTWLDGPSLQHVTTDFARAQLGEVSYLIGAIGDMPVAKLCIDYVRRSHESAAYLWTFAVMPQLRRLGIGKIMMRVAEQLVVDGGFNFMELAVNNDNPDAKRLYERLGYEVVGDHLDEWSYIDTDGNSVEVRCPGKLLRKALT